MMTTYTYPWYWALGSTLVGLAFIAWGWRHYKASGFGLSAIRFWLPGALLVILAAPGFVLAEVRVSNEAVSYTRGLWFEPENRELRFSSVGSVVRAHRRTRWFMTEEFWIVTFRDGRSEELNLGDIWRYNAEEIAARMAAQGVRFTRADA